MTVTPKTLGRTLFIHRQPFWGPLMTILGFVGGVAVNMVSKCPQALLGWHFSLSVDNFLLEQ